MHGFPPEVTDAILKALDRYQREKIAKEALSLAYRKARRVLSQEQATVVLEVVDHGMAASGKARQHLRHLKVLRRHQTRLSAQELAEIYRSGTTQALPVEEDRE